MVDFDMSVKRIFRLINLRLTVLNQKVRRLLRILNLGLSTYKSYRNVGTGVWNSMQIAWAYMWYGRVIITISEGTMKVHKDTWVRKG